MTSRLAGAVVGAALSLLLLAGCGDDNGGDDVQEASTAATVDAQALEAWLTALPPSDGIWAHCQAKDEDDPAGPFTNVYLVAWDGYALAAGPDDPAIAGTWREFIEAGTVWSSSVAAGVDEPGQIDAVIEQRAELVEALSAHLDEEAVAEALPVAPSESLEC